MFPESYLPLLRAHILNGQELNQVLLPHPEFFGHGAGPGPSPEGYGVKYRPLRYFYSAGDRPQLRGPGNLRGLSGAATQGVVLAAQVPAV